MCSVQIKSKALSFISLNYFIINYLPCIEEVETLVQIRIMNVKRLNYAQTLNLIDASSQVGCYNEKYRVGHLTLNPLTDLCCNPICLSMMSHSFSKAMRLLNNHARSYLHIPPSYFTYLFSLSLPRRTILIRRILLHIEQKLPVINIR